MKTGIYIRVRTLDNWINLDLADAPRKDALHWITNLSHPAQLRLIEMLLDMIPEQDDDD